MSARPESLSARTDFPPCKVINCILPDDGTHKRLLVELRKKKGVIRAGSAIRRGIAALGAVKTKRGKLPASELVRHVFVICAEDQADEIFDLIFWGAKIEQPGRGMMWQQAVTGCTPYELPLDIPDEESGA